MATSPSAAQSGQYVQANGINIYFEQYGSGEPLLLLHGGVVNHTMWDNHIPSFAEHYTVIAPDSRGHGRTKNVLDTMSFRLLADDMAAFIRALGLDRPSVCGYSDGGQIALEMAMNYPQLARAYVIGAASLKWTEGFLQFTKAFGIEGQGVVDFEQLERDSPWAVPMMRAKHDEFQGHDYWKTYVMQASKMWLAPLNYSPGEFQKISEPCLILVGDRDNLSLPVEHAVELYRIIPNAELAIVPGADHGMPWSQQELFTQLVLEFLLRKSSRREEG